MIDTTLVRIGNPYRITFPHGNPSHFGMVATVVRRLNEHGDFALDLNGEEVSYNGVWLEPVVG